MSCAGHLISNTIDDDMWYAQHTRITLAPTGWCSHRIGGANHRYGCTRTCATLRRFEWAPRESRHRLPLRNRPDNKRISTTPSWKTSLAVCHSCYEKPLVHARERVTPRKSLNDSRKGNQIVALGLQEKNMLTNEKRAKKRKMSLGLLKINIRRRTWA